MYAKNVDLVVIYFKKTNQSETIMMMTAFFIGLSIFILAFMYYFLFSQHGEIPTSTELTDLQARIPHSSQNIENTHPLNNDLNDFEHASLDSSDINRIKVLFFDRHFDEVIPENWNGIHIPVPLRLILCLLLYPLIVFIRYTYLFIKWLVRLLAEIIAEFIFGVIIRGVFFIIKGLLFALLRIFD